MISVTLDKANMEGGGVIWSYSDNNRVFAMNARDAKAYVQLKVIDCSDLFVICIPIHEWLVEQCPKYQKKVRLRLVRKSDPNTLELLPDYFVLDFDDHNLALMFKLAWGGA
jgi:hypothetical protein